MSQCTASPINIAHSLQSCVLKNNCLIIACTPIAVMDKVSRLVLGNLVTRASLNPAVPLPGSGLPAPHKARHAHCCVFSPSQWSLTADADSFWMQLSSYKTFSLSWKWFRDWSVSWCAQGVKPPDYSDAALRRSATGCCFDSAVLKLLQMWFWVESGCRWRNSPLLALSEVSAVWSSRWRPCRSVSCV